jgi:serine/threonine-protein kinase
MEEGFMSTDIIFNAPSKNGFSENLNVIAKNIPGASALSLSDLKSSLVEGYKTVINNFKLIDTKDATVDGRPALIITYTGSEGDLKGNFIQYFTIKGDDAYIITVTRPQDEATRSEKEFATMVKSFKITK